MGSWRSSRCFYAPIRAGSCCEMKSLHVLLSRLFSFSHTHIHTRVVTNPCVLPPVFLSSYVLHGIFSCMPSHADTQAFYELVHLMLTICSWLLRPSWGTRLMEVTCLRPGTQPRLPPARSHWWEGQVLPEVSHAFELPCREEVLGGTSSLKICLSLAKDLPFSSAGCQKHLCWIQHNKSSPFSQLTWGIMQVTQLFFPSDFANSQDVKKHVDISASSGSIPPEDWRVCLIFMFLLTLPAISASLLRHPSEAAVALLDCSIFFSVRYFPFLKITLKKHFTLKKYLQGRKIQCPKGLKLRHVFSGGRLMNHWGKLWRQVVPISSGMICWEKSFCHLKALGLHASVTRKEPLVHVYRGGCFMVISDLNICNSGKLPNQNHMGLGIIRAKRCIVPPLGGGVKAGVQVLKFNLMLWNSSRVLVCALYIGQAQKYCQGSFKVTHLF